HSSRHRPPCCCSRSSRSCSRRAWPDPGPLLTELAHGLDELRALPAPFTPEAVAPVTGISSREIRRLARELAAASTAAVYGRIGTCTQEFGTVASWLVDVLNV